MARVAKCPQCEHDLLVPDDSAASGLAKCPTCKSFFELEHAESRELPQVVLVDTKTDASTSQTAPTVSDLPPVGIETNKPQEPETDDAYDLDDEPLELETSTKESPEAAAQRIDQWFRSAKTLSDVPPSAVGSDDEIEVEKIEAADLDRPAGGRTIDISDMHAAGGFDSDFELDQPAETSHDIAAWDDAQDMERLLAGIENQPVHALETSDHETGSDFHDEPQEEHAKGAEAWTPDPSMQITPGRDEPRRKRSIVRTLLVTTVGGLMGLALGYYALLWLRGPEIDFLEVAKYLPKSALPASFQKVAKKSAVSPAPSMIDDLAAADKKNEAPPESKAPTDEKQAPAEKQAAFTTPVEPPKTSSATDDRYPAAPAKTEAPAPAHEPAPLDAPPAKAISETAPRNEPIHIANAPTFTPDELAAALQAAKDARPGLVTGNFNDGTEVKRAKGASYATMADLAQKATFVGVFATPADATKMNEQIDKLFRQTLLDAHTREEVAQITPMWIASSHRKHGGVFFAGSVTHQESKGTVVECTVDLGGGKSLVFLTSPAAAQKVGGSSQPVAVVGYIVDKPTERIQGYSGSAPQAVFAPGLLSLE